MATVFHRRARKPHRRHFFYIPKTKAPDLVQKLGSGAITRLANYLGRLRDLEGIAALGRQQPLVI